MKKAIVPAALLALIALGMAWGVHRSGQAGSAAPAADDASEASIAGRWESVDDAAYAIAFDDAGGLTELYAGEPTATGTYAFAASPEGYAAAAAQEEGGTYLLQDVAGERYAYRVLELTSSSLVLSYLERGNTLSFVRR